MRTLTSYLKFNNKQTGWTRWSNILSPYPAHILALIFVLKNVVFSLLRLLYIFKFNPDYFYMCGSRGVQLVQGWGKGWSKYHCKRTIIGQTLKVGLVACDFQGSGPILLRNPIFVIFQCGRPSGSVHRKSYQQTVWIQIWVHIVWNI